MNSLKFKFIGLTTIIVIFAVSLTVWQNLRTQDAMLSKVAAQNCKILGETIRSSIINSMAAGKNDEVSKIFDNIKSEETIQNIRIFDESGKILISAVPSEIGDLVPASDLFAFRSNRFSFYADHQNNGLYRSVLPINNAPACYSCHNAAQKVLGILNVHYSVDDIKILQNNGRRATIISSVGMIVVLVLSITLFILFYVDYPIRKLIRAMTHLEQGDFENATAEIDNSKEMSLLSSKFNQMVKRLKNQLDTVVNHERELATSKEKLMYHDELHNMNNTLEERLKEIEYLNITLEERIEEIEEANFKIADLASELEDKNTFLENAVARLSALHRIGLAVNSTMDLEELFSLLIRNACTILEGRFAHILILSEDKKTLIPKGSVGFPDHLGLSKEIPFKAGGIVHWVVAHKKPILIKNIEETQEFNKLSLLGFVRKTVISAPLVINDEVIGAISISNRHNDSCFNESDLELLVTIATQASGAIKNARLYKQQQAAYLSTVQALVSAVEASDAYTRGHSERVTRYSLTLGQKIGLPTESLHRLEQAAVLHDIGKIGIDAALLHKKDTLTDDDIYILRQHPSIGVKILEPIDFLTDIRKIIEQHHEQYDGNGYPNRLEGEEILIEARILAVADTYDAMTSDRPYHDALSHEITIEEIEANAGRQFDPQIVEAFIEMCQQDEISF
ncbi:MAG: HD domain-containing protein [Desulfuromonadales bacterium]|nr:HD domain-containing protein [Desulfuromonadales bacterium]